MDKLLVDLTAKTETLVPLTAAELADKAANAAADTARVAENSVFEGNATTLRGRADAALQALEDANANWGSLTAAQKDAAAKLVVRSTAGIIRLLLRRLEAAP